MKVFEVRAKVGTYKTASGEVKSDWLKIGNVFEGEDGRLSGRIKTAPLNWDGSFVLSEVQKHSKDNPFD
jgi:hypothetical protein